MHNSISADDMEYLVGKPCDLWEPSTRSSAFKWMTDSFEEPVRFDILLFHGAISSVCVFNEYILFSPTRKAFSKALLNYINKRVTVTCVSHVMRNVSLCWCIHIMSPWWSGADRLLSQNVKQNHHLHLSNKRQCHTGMVSSWMSSISHRLLTGRLKEIGECFVRISTFSSNPKMKNGFGQGYFIQPAITVPSVLSIRPSRSQRSEMR